MEFRAVVIDNEHDVQSIAIRTLQDTDLMEGDTLVRVTHSSLNYKDGLAVTNKAPVVRRFPMVPGIDLAGIVEETSSSRISIGDRVLLNGWGTGEVHFGAWSEKARVWGKWLLPLPPTFSAAQAMAIGTAGYTAALCVLALRDAGIDPTRGPVLVTGAAGGVGSVAVALLAACGYSVVASTGRPSEAEYLKRLGAAEVISREELAGKVKPLAKERWAAAIDSVGSTTLANALSMIKYGGAVAACGLAGGMDLPTSVAPFILRGISLLGVDSVMAPNERRLEAWALLEAKLDVTILSEMTTTVKLEDAIANAELIVDGKIRGRVVIDVGSNE